MTPIVRHLLLRLDAHRPAQADPLGWRCFQLGLFVLPASALLAGVLLLVPFIAGSRGRLPWWRDRLNQLLMVVAGLMVASAMAASLRTQALPSYPLALAWWGLFNWLPMFWAFWAFQPYLADRAARRRVGLALVAGTVPVVITGLGQLFLGWHGPWQTLGGAVVWHLQEGGRPRGRLSGLFDYANITAAWLSLSWPLLLAALLACWRRWRERLAGSGWSLLVVLALVAAQLLALVLTDSRNAWGAMLLAVPLVAGPGSWLWLLPLLLLALFPVLLATLPGVPALLLVLLVLGLLIRGVRRGMLSASVFDRAWWASVLVLAVLHGSDIPMYDSRINIAGWVLLAGLRCWSPLPSEPPERA